MRCRTGLPAFAFLLLTAATGPGRRAGRQQARPADRRGALRRCPHQRVAQWLEKSISNRSPSLTAVTTLVVYKVGSADEDKTFTGLSHYLEHLMFKGTDQLKPGDIDRITLRAGGANNAYTSDRPDRLSLHPPGRTLAAGAGNRSRPHAQPAHRQGARVRQGKRGRHQRAGTATRTPPGTWSPRRSCRSSSASSTPTDIR